MKNCTHCKHARWNKTAAGRLHPSGDGECGYEVKLPQLPQSMYWFGARPTVLGGHVNRRTELRDHCAHFERGER